MYEREWRLQYTGCAATSTNGVITRWRYDNASQVLARTLPQAQEQTFVYDILGRKTSHIDFRGLSARL
jgi:YD repeat-containing protein